MRGFLMKFFLIFILSDLIFSCSHTVKTAQVDLNNELVKKVKVVAVIPFKFENTRDDSLYMHRRVNNWMFESLGEEVANELSSRLIRVRSFDVVSRNNLDKILEEQSTSVSDLYDIDSARKIGKLALADAVIIGEITNFQGINFGGIIAARIYKMRVSLQMIDVETGKIVLSASHFMEDDDVPDEYEEDRAALKYTIVEKIVDEIKQQLGETQKILY